METDFVPTGDSRLRSILKDVEADGDSVESAGLEIKSEIDPSSKAGFTKIAKFILGMANRTPDDAQRHFRGYGVMVVGAARGAAAGIPKGVEAHELRDKMAPYLGPEGPTWDLGRLSVSNDAEVLFIIVDPPEPGQPAFPCCKDYQGTTRSDSLADGDIYIRKGSSTRKASSEDVRALVRRATTGTQLNLDVSLTVKGEGLFVRDTTSLLKDLSPRRQKGPEKRIGNAKRRKNPEPTEPARGPCKGRCPEASLKGSHLAMGRRSIPSYDNLGDTQPGPRISRQSFVRARSLGGRTGRSAWTHSLVSQALLSCLPSRTEQQAF